MQKIINRIHVLHTELENNALATDAKNLISAKIIMLANKLETNPQFSISKLPFNYAEYERITTLFKNYLKSIMPTDIQHTYYDYIDFTIKNDFVFLQHIIYYLVQQAYLNDRKFFLLSEQENFKAKNFNDLIEDDLIYFHVVGHTLKFNLINHKFQVRLNDWISCVLFAKEKDEHNAQLEAIPYNQIKKDMKHPELQGCTITYKRKDNKLHISLMDTMRRLLSEDYHGNGLEDFNHLENKDLTDYGQFVRELIMLIGDNYNYTYIDPKTHAYTCGYDTSYQLGNSQKEIPFKIVDSKKIFADLAKQQENQQPNTEEDVSISDNNKLVIDASIDNQSEQAIVTYVCPIRVSEMVPIDGRMRERTTELSVNVDVEHPTKGRSTIKVPWTYQVHKGDKISDADIEKDWSEDIKQDLANFKERKQKEYIEKLAEEHKLREQALAKKRDKDSQLSLYDDLDNSSSKKKHVA